MKRFTEDEKLTITEVAAHKAVQQILQGYKVRCTALLQGTMQMVRPDCCEGDELLISRAQFDELIRRMRTAIAMQLQFRGYKVTGV